MAKVKENRKRTGGGGPTQADADARGGGKTGKYESAEAVCLRRERKGGIQRRCRGERRDGILATREVRERSVERPLNGSSKRKKQGHQSARKSKKGKNQL